MYNGLGLPTARGSGTSGYVQSNRFSAKQSNPVIGSGEETTAVTRKPNEEILEHERKRGIQVKLVELEDKLIDQGYSESEIAQKLEEARKVLEASHTSGESSAAAAAATATATATGSLAGSGPRTHQMAARNEEKMEAFRAALRTRGE